MPIAETSDQARQFSVLRAARGRIADGRACLRLAQQQLRASRAWLDALDLPAPQRAARLSSRAVLDTIAEAFEVTPRDIVLDAAVVSSGGCSHVPIQRWLQQRHGWDGSVAPYYLAHLRGLLRAKQWHPPGTAP